MKLKKMVFVNFSAIERDKLVFFHEISEYLILRTYFNDPKIARQIKF